MYPEYEKKKSVNKSAVVRIVIWSVVLALMVGLLTCAFVFGGDGFIFGINFNAYTYENADSYSVGNGESADTITSLDIDWVDGSVKIIPTDGDKITVTEDYDGDEDARRLRWKVEDGELTVKYQASGWGSLMKVSRGKNLTVEVPKAMLEAMNETDIVVVSADLTVNGMVSKEIDIDVVSGAVTLSECRTDSLDIETVSGNIKYSGVIGEGDFDGVSATVELHLDDVDALNIDTVSGDVSLFLPEATEGFEVMMDAVSGSINVHGFDGLTQSKGYCRFGDGSVKINVDAVSGSLKIEEVVAD